MSIISDARPLLIDVLRREEGLRLRPYRCAAGVPTIGVGATTYPDGRAVLMSDPPISESAAIRMLAVECDRYLLDILRLCTNYPTAHQAAAMASLAYNIGLHGFSRSSVLSAHNRGDIQAAARAFGLWNKAKVNGALTVLPGLVSRRSRESALYLTPDADSVPDPMPQAVAPESSIAKSPIASSGAIVAVAGVAQAVTEVASPTPVVAVQAAGEQAGVVAQSIQHIKTLFVDVLGIPQSAWLPVVLIVAGAVVVWWRVRQRRGGWA